MEERRQKRCVFLSLKPEVTRYGSVDTDAGLSLTSEEPLKLAQEKHRSDSLKIAKKQRKEAETAPKGPKFLQRKRLSDFVMKQMRWTCA